MPIPRPISNVVSSLNHFTTSSKQPWNGSKISSFLFYFHILHQVLMSVIYLCGHTILVVSISEK